MGNRITCLGSVCIRMSCILILVILSGCYRIYHGHYVAAEAPAWKKSEYAGGNFFRYPTKHTPDWYISIAGNKNGKVRLSIGSAAYDPGAIWKLLNFSGDPIRILLQGSKEWMVIPADGFQFPCGLNLDVPASADFTVVTPSFKIGENTVPELPTHVHWSNEQFGYWVPLQ